MPPKHIETRLEMLQRFQRVARSMTQEQVDACAWLMGGYSCGWTPETLGNLYQDVIDKTEKN